MSQPGKFIAAALLLFLLAGVQPMAAQKPIPEFYIAVAPSVVTVHQGEMTTLTVNIRCNDSSFIAIADCTGREKFDLSFSPFPEGMRAETAAGRIGANTVAITVSSKAAVGSFPVQVTVIAGSTTQEQTFLLSVKRSASSSSSPPEEMQPGEAPASPGATWEHHVLVASSPEEFNYMADELGQDSWELVSVIRRRDAGAVEWIGFFKRPKS